MTVDHAHTDSTLGLAVERRANFGRPSRTLRRERVSTSRTSECAPVPDGRLDTNGAEEEHPDSRGVQRRQIPERAGAVPGRLPRSALLCTHGVGLKGSGGIGQALIRATLSGFPVAVPQHQNGPLLDTATRRRAQWASRRRSAQSSAMRSRGVLAGRALHGLPHD